MLTDRLKMKNRTCAAGATPGGSTAAARSNPYAQVVTNSEHFSSTQGPLASP